jgi:hypothetical protein
MQCVPHTSGLIHATHSMLRVLLYPEKEGYIESPLIKGVQRASVVRILVIQLYYITRSRTHASCMKYNSSDKASSMQTTERKPWPARQELGLLIQKYKQCT